MPETRYKQIMTPYVSPLSPMPTSVKPQNSLTVPVQAVLFDIYGTLFISASGDIGRFSQNRDLKTSVNMLLEKYNLPTDPDALRQQVVQAVLSDHAVKKEQGIDYPEVEIDALWQQVLQVGDMKIVRQFAVEYEMIVNPTYPMPHLRDTIETLKMKSIPMGIVSNAQFFTPHLFDLFMDGFPETLGFDPELIFYSYKYGYAKPSLYLFDLAAKKLFAKGVHPEEALYVGNDVEKDIAPARETGFKTCLFAGDQRSLRMREDEIDLQTRMPDAVITDLNQLTDMIG
jgi:putative hydrolase of the HAD superfamily